jgi:hypothetical protein
MAYQSAPEHTRQDSRLCVCFKFISCHLIFLPVFPSLLEWTASPHHGRTPHGRTHQENAWCSGTLSGIPWWSNQGIALCLQHPGLNLMDIEIRYRSKSSTHLFNHSFLCRRTPDNGKTTIWDAGRAIPGVLSVHHSSLTHLRHAASLYRTKTPGSTRYRSASSDAL